MCNGWDTEWAVLEALGTERASSIDWESVRLSDADEIDWGHLIYLAIWHRVYPLVAAVLTEEPGPLRLPPFLNTQFREVARVNRHRVGVFRQQARRLVAALEKRGVVVACTKGVAMDALLYGGRGLRSMMDIDLMIDPAGRSLAEEAFEDQGFEVGDDGEGSETVRPFDRQELLVYRLYPDHLPRRVMRLDDPILPLCEVDVAFSFTWHSADYQPEMGRLLADLQRVHCGEAELPTLSNFNHFLFAVLHLFREAWVEPWKNPYGNVRLQKFLDIHRFWTLFRSELVERGGDVRALGLAEPVAWVLAHTDRLFGTDSVRGMGLQEQAHVDWLRTAQTAGGATVLWSGDIRDRLRAPTRLSDFQPEPR